MCSACKEIIRVRISHPEIIANFFISFMLPIFNNFFDILSPFSRKSVKVYQFSENYLVLVKISSFGYLLESLKRIDFIKFL